MQNELWKKENLSKIVGECFSIAEVLRRLDLKPQGQNYRTAKKYISAYALNISHFLGQRYRFGKTGANRILRETSSLLIRNSPMGSKHIKTRVLRENLLIYKCADCGISDWKGKKLVLQLDHINGVNDDHRLENLQLLCPNCHSQTDTYCGRNVANRTQKLCVDCDTPILATSSRCRRCTTKLRSENPAYKIVWPSIPELEVMISELGLKATGRKLGVSDSAIRKHIKTHS